MLAFTLVRGSRGMMVDGGKMRRFLRHTATRPGPRSAGSARREQSHGVYPEHSQSTYLTFLRICCIPEYQSACSYIAKLGCLSHLRITHIERARPYTRLRKLPAETEAHRDYPRSCSHLCIRAIHAHIATQRFNNNFSEDRSAGIVRI